MVGDLQHDDNLLLAENQHELVNLPEKDDDTIDSERAAMKKKQ